MVSCEYCQIFKNTYFEEYLRKPASKNFNNHSSSQVLYKVKNKYSFEHSARFFHHILKTTTI